MPHDPASNFQSVCRVTDVPSGTGRMFVVAETTIGVFNVGGRFFALANACPHGGASLAHGIVDGDTVTCRIHHWRFYIRDGKYLDEDKPQCDVQTFTVRVVGEEVQIAVAADGPSSGIHEPLTR